jgi:hypothetical protein
MSFDFETWWKKRQEEKRLERRDDFGAVCSSCGEDVLDLLEAAAYDWSDGLPSSRVIECPGCGAELEFCLEWETTLSKVTLTTGGG